MAKAANVKRRGSTRGPNKRATPDSRSGLVAWSPSLRSASLFLGGLPSVIGEECQNLGAAQGLVIETHGAAAGCIVTVRDRPVRAGERHRRKGHAHALVYHEAVSILLAHPAP